MRHFFTTSTLLLFFALNSFSQSITPQVISVNGKYYSGANFSLAYTIGEPLTTTLTGTNNIITQGFNQPSYSITSVAEVENPVYDLIIYPNPTDGEIIILNQGKNFQPNTQLFIVDVLGRKLIAQNLNDKQTNINLQSLAAGNYFLVIDEAGKNSFTHKLTKVQ